jgi:hypothetical protein
LGKGFGERRETANGEDHDGDRSGFSDGNQVGYGGVFSQAAVASHQVQADDADGFEGDRPFDNARNEPVSLPPECY